MSIPLMEFAPSSANVRVDGFEVPGDEQPRIFTTDYVTSSAELDVLIQAAYRQVFHPSKPSRPLDRVCSNHSSAPGRLALRTLCGVWQSRMHFGA